MKTLQDSIRAALVQAGVVAAKGEAAKAPPERPRWKDGVPRKMTAQGWRTDYRALLAERFDTERMTVDASYATRVYGELGDGDAALGERRFSEALAEAYVEGKAEALAAQERAHISQSAYEAEGGRERVLREEQRKKLEAQRAALDAELLALDESSGPAE